METRSAGVRYPVVTLMLYYGYERRWGGKRTLKERLRIPPRLDPYVNDYRINLFEIAYLDRARAAMFRSDYGIVVDYFMQMRENGDYVPTMQEIVHVQETLQMLSVMTQDNRFEEACGDAGVGTDGRIVERRPRNMCEVLDRVENRGVERGIAQGEDKLALLMSQLFAQNRMSDARRASEDREYRAELMRELGIK